MKKTERVYRVVALIPEGRVLTYGALARLSGVKNPRLAGQILHNNPDPQTIPCHRVVDRQGRLARNFAFGGARGQAERLKAEGVAVRAGRIELDRYRWRPTPKDRSRIKIRP